MADNIIFDANVDFLGGQDASKAPDRIPPNCFASGVNVSTDQGKIKPRWGLATRDLVFPEGGITLPTLAVRSFESIYKSGKFQALIPYSVGNEYFLVIIISGVIFLVNQNTYDVQVIEIEGGEKLNELSPRLNWSNAGRFLVVFDFPAYPIIIEGITARRANPADFEVPISVLGAYNQNRLFISNNGNEFTAGDPAGNPLTPDAPITFEEVIGPSAPFAGQVFQLSTNYNNDPITCMTFLQSTDTSTGIGQFLVSTKSAIYSYNTQVPRAQWEAGQFGSIFTFNTGIVGPRATINVNSDLFFMSPDGQMRAASMSRDEQLRWSKTPISREVDPWLKTLSPELLQYAVLSYTKNKLFMTVNPFRTKALTTTGNESFDYAFGGFVVLEMDNISTLGQGSPPAWAGLWTGCRPMDIVTNNDRIFIMSKDDAFTNQLYEFTPDTTIDMIHGAERPIVSQLDSRQYTFQDPFHDKELHSIDVALTNLKGDFNMEIKYKPSHSPKYLDWVDFKHIAPYRVCDIPNDLQVNGLSSQAFKRLVFGVPSSNLDCSPITQEYYKMFRKLQVSFKLTGRYWELQEYKVKAVVKPQSELVTVCTSFPVVELYSECSDDWFIPEVNLCLKSQS